MKYPAFLSLLIAFTGAASGLAPLACAEPANTRSSPAVAGEDGLARVLQVIAAHSPDILAAQAGRNQALAQVEQARAAWFGKVDAYALNQHFNDPRLTRAITQPPNVATYPFAEDQFGYGIEVQLPIDISRQIAAEVDAARSRANGARWSAEDVRLRTLLQGAALYRSLQTLSGQRQALDQQLESLRASERTARTGLKVGNIARLSLLRVQAAVAEVQASKAGVEGLERKQRAQLAALMGAAEFVDPMTTPSAGPAAPPADPGDMPPSLHAAQDALLASQAKLTSAQRAQYPQLSVNGGWNHNAIQWDTRAVDTWQVNLALRMNLWAGGAQRSAVDAAQAVEDEAYQRLEGAQDNLHAAREGALAQWNAQQQSWRAALSGLAAAEESARIEQDRFRTGLGSAIDLIDAEAALARARASTAAAISGWWQADDALRYAYGLAPLAFQESHSTTDRTQP